MGNTIKKRKATLSVEMNIKDMPTSYADIGAKEILKGFKSSTIQEVAMRRLDNDYLLVDIIVLFKGRVNLNKGNADFKLVPGSFYVYENVDIADWKYIRQQALTGNSMGKAIGKSLVNSSYEYTKLDI
jgi:hypothetical protein